MMLLDTHVLYWLVDGDPKLGKKARIRIENSLNKEQVYVSAITFWEMAFLIDRKRITLEKPLENWRRAILDYGIKELPVSGTIGIMAVRLKDYHGDPADRIIIASALDTSASLMTADRTILRWKGKLGRIDARK